MLVLFVVGFISEYISLTEPDEGETRTIDIPIVRTGGTMGVVAVDWQATLDGIYIAFRLLYLCFPLSYGKLKV